MKGVPVNYLSRWYDSHTAMSPLDSVVEFDPLGEPKASQVNFDPKVLDRQSNKISRDLTPFPKELHSKAMQWRASRNIILEEGGGAGEGVAVAGGQEVTMRKHQKKGPINRDSLLTALSEPLDEVCVGGE